MRLLNKVAAIAVLAAVSIQAQAGAMRAGFDANTFNRNDDGSINVNTGINFDFFGISGPNVWLNNNGNITFTGSLSTYTPFGITSGSTPMIAPFFADVDTSGPGVGDPVKYGAGTVDGHAAFGFTWDNVAHYNEALPLNSFQLVLIDRSDISAGAFDFEFNYDEILWESGQASGSNGAGLGGEAARVGYTNGAGTFFELTGSGVNGAFLDSGPASTSLVNNSLNSNVDGRYLFTVRNGVVSVPAPAPIVLFGLALVALGLRRRA